MQKCTFSSISKTIAENISNAHRLNQTEFFIRLFYHFWEKYPNFDYDNGSICRWINGKRNISRKFAVFYADEINRQYLRYDIEYKIFPFLFDLFFVVDEVFNLIISDTTISYKKKMQLVRKYPCENTKAAANFLADCIVFTLEKGIVKTVAAENSRNENLTAYNQLACFTENLKIYTDKISKGSEEKMYKVDEEKYEKIGTDTEKKIGDTLFIVRAYATKNAKKTAQEMIMEIGEERLKKDLESGEFYRRLENGEQEQ